MFFRITVAILALSSLASAGERAPMLTASSLVAAAVESATDNIGSGWCGRGMLSVLRSVGLGSGLQGGDGQDWEKILSHAGWRPVSCTAPHKAPLGSVLVYLGDARVGKRLRGTPGGYHGHVEMVALNPNGQRLYVSDCARVAPGGTVRDNFTCRAWLPPGRAIWTAPPVQKQIETVVEQRLHMAIEYFNRPQLAALRPAPLQ